MSQIFTSVVNRPDFVEIQAKLFRKFMKDDYQFNVLDDSIDPVITKEFKDICKMNDIKYYRNSSSVR